MPSLDALLASDIEVPAVVTNPDRPAGRGMEVQPSPVKRRALEAGLEVLEPARARDPGLAEHLRRLAPDVATVVAYGKILPSSLLSIPSLGFVNLHFSLLPAYRGAAPVQRALMDGARETGVSAIVLTEGMDEGPILATEAVGVEEDESAGRLGARLAEVGARLLLAALRGYAEGSIRPRPQDERNASYAPKIGEDDARIDWRRPARDIRNLARALDPQPGAWTALQGRRLKVYRAAPVEDAAPVAPGKVAVDGGRLLAGASDAVMVLEEVQFQGKRRMPGEDAARGLRLDPGARFG